MRRRVGEVRKLQVDLRYVQHVRQQAVRDVYDALVELITNADDSYGRLYRAGRSPKNGGDILLEHDERRRGERSRIIVRDKAEGMDAECMEKRLANIGAYTSQAGNRGYMGRGAKDCTELGDLTYESIRGGRYYRCRITHDFDYCLEEAGRAATPADRDALGLAGNADGTSVTLELSSDVVLPRIQKLTDDLPWHYALRCVMGEASDSRVRLRKLGAKGERPVALVYHQPEGEVVVDDIYVVPGWDQVEAHLQVWKAPRPLPVAAARFSRAGLIVQSGRAVHECTLMPEKLAGDPHTLRYFGVLTCDHIDGLLQDYEERLVSGGPHPPANPRLVIDPNRRTGLDRDHPFTRALLERPRQLLSDLVAHDIERERAGRREIADQESKARLARLARMATEFMRESLEDLGDAAAEGDLEPGAAKSGFYIFPKYARVFIGDRRNLTVYISRQLLGAREPRLSVECDAPGELRLAQAAVSLRPDARREERLIGTVTVEALAANPSPVVVAVTCPGIESAEACVAVIDVDQREFGQPFEFESREYTVQHGRTRTLRLFAECPNAVSVETPVTARVEDGGSVVVRGRCILAPVPRTNYARGDLVVEGRRLGGAATVTCDLNGYTTTARVRVIPRSQPPNEVPLELFYHDGDFGSFRSKWATEEGKPNLLLIAAKHKALARYLGPEPPFPGQHLPHFRALVVEIVGDAVCRRMLREEADRRPGDFDLSSDPAELIEQVFLQYHRKLTEFTEKGHRVMISDEEVRAAADAVTSR